MNKDVHSVSPATSPVFVVGMNGSGTTMLGDCLGHHPDLYMLPHESYVLPHFIYHLKSYGDLSTLPARRRLADALGRSKAYWAVNRGNPVRLDDDALAQPGFAGVVNGLYGYLAAQKGKTRWGDVTPMHLQHMELLVRHFPDAKFVHIYRDGREAAQSFHRRWRQEPRRTIYRWKKIVELGHEQGARLGPSQYKEVCYEALTDRPDKHMQEICKFLDLSFDPNVLSSSMRYIDASIGVGSGGILRNSNKWRDYFSATQVWELENIAGKFLDELGYAVETVPGDNNPTPWHLRTWMVKDKLNVTLCQFRRYGLGYANVFIRRIRDSIRQTITNKY